MGKRSTARKLAMQALYQYQIQKDNAGDILQYTLEKDSYIDDTKKFASEIYTGILENFDVIDPLIRKHSIDWKFERIAEIDKSILRIGIWELIFTETSTKVIMAEMIELIRKYSVYEAIKFINGLLGVIAKQRKEIAKKCSPV